MSNKHCLTFRAQSISRKMIRLRHKCGRMALRPNEEDVNEEITGEGEDWKSKVESLRTKIALKKRYNKACLEEMLETNAGAHRMIFDLIERTDSLRNEKFEALSSEQAAGTRALRTDKKILLALQGKHPEEILIWLDDQTFDLRKKLDLSQSQLDRIRGKLASSEKIVQELELSPITNAQPWEEEAENVMVTICVKIAERDILRDATKILNIKYKEILLELKDQKGHWPLEVRELEMKVEDYENELNEIVEMTSDAFKLRDSAQHRYLITLNDYNDNKAARKKQIILMRKQAERDYAKKINQYRKDSRNSKQVIVKHAFHSEHPQEESKEITASEALHRQQAQVHAFEAAAKTLVDVMHVPDLRHCPARLIKLWTVKKGLTEAADIKFNLKELLIKQKANLTLIAYHLQFTGAQMDDAFVSEVKIREAEIAEMVKKKNAIHNKLNKFGKLVQEWRLNCLGIDDELNLGNYKTIHPPVQDIKISIRLIQAKLVEIMERNKDIRNQLAKVPAFKHSEQYYEAYVQLPRTLNANRQSELFEQIENEQVDEFEEEIHASTLDVPTSAEIKAKSKRVVKQGKMRIGIR